ncbi:hypothetical protein [Arsukibacterium perlucidum]|uniref:hypothetical protein n=1 Tax=Arsukibacterium perlucidum TaxID=368811 RepID=UPI0003728FD5|nr:hypothetical protein [Arsukibacterium perlucidum]
MKLWQKVLLIAWVIGLLIAGYGIITSEDKAIYRLKEWTPDTHYRVLEIYPQNAQVPKTGRLGAFYSCLTFYQRGIDRSVTTPITAINESFEIRVDEDIVIDFGVNGVEAYSFDFLIYGKKREIISGTDIYAVNCDIRLLDKPDSDMHCEDRLLGNSIRPVCTYRPEQDNNTNNEQ